MKTVIENDSDARLYRIGEGGDADKDDRIEGAIYEWGEVADLEFNGITQKAFVSAEGELFCYPGGPAEFDAEEWDLADQYQEQENSDEEEEEEEAVQ
jgi:hypothetical protein